MGDALSLSISDIKCACCASTSPLFSSARRCFNSLRIPARNKKSGTLFCSTSLSYHIVLRDSVSHAKLYVIINVFYEFTFFNCCWIVAGGSFLGGGFFD